MQFRQNYISQSVNIYTNKQELFRPEYGSVACN